MKRPTKADIVPRCECDSHRIVTEELGERRYYIASGDYGDQYIHGGYYVAQWYRFECAACGAQSVDFHVMKWGTRYQYPISSPFEDAAARARKYRALYDAIKEQMK